MKHIELFAGCGGLCLGLEKAGFDLTMANELSPMAAETFAYNFLGENLSEGNLPNRKTLWLGSTYAPNEFKSRLREDPRNITDFSNCEIQKDGSNILNSLIVGNIDNLNAWLKNNPEALKVLKDQSVDLISGGPPCQSFSLAGLREKNNAKNKLPWSFAEFVGLIRPKVVLLENVSGILRPFTENGQKYYAWFEVAKVFAQKNYIPLCLHINAKYAGVAQSRPRFILIAVDKNFFKQIEKSLNPNEVTLFSSARKFYKKLKQNKAVGLEDLAVFDLNSDFNHVAALFNNSFLAPLVKKRKNFFSVKDAIGDLDETSDNPISKYVQDINKKFTPLLALPASEITGHSHVKITDRVQRRYRIYQVIKELSHEAQKDLSLNLSGKKDSIDDDSWKEIKQFKFLNEGMKLSKFKNKSDFETFIRNHQTKKRSQRALSADEPSPAALSIADDICHYSALRTLTTREMARIQSFPDSFVFRSKTTTGGLNRRFEVPIYTQIGNAVPVLLGYALGLAVKNLLEKE